VADSPGSALREFSLEPPDNERLANLCGPLDENLRLIESRLGVEVRRRGSAFRVQGAKVVAAESLLRELFRMTRTEDITPETVHLALRDHDVTAAEASRSSASAATGSSPAVGGTGTTGTADATGREVVGREAVGRDAAAADDDGEAELRTLRGTIRARGANQREYLRRIRRNDLTFGVGPAGTGKTYLAVACAVESLQSDRVRRIVLVRPAVEAGERLGFLPGDLTQKVDPYLRPMYDALYEMMGFDRVAKLIERNVIEVAPLAFMRGRSLNDSFIILDEAQNTTVEQMKMFLTRIGFGSRAVVTGDVTQTDLPTGKLSGLRHVLDVLRGVQGVGFQFFEARDVVRHPLVQRIVQAYEAREADAT
jgi:phosphate starvation-inducible PhoH-like protein